MAKSLIEMNPKVLKLVQHYWQANNDYFRWRDTSAALFGAGVVSEYELSLELYDLADIAREKAMRCNHE